MFALLSEKNEACVYKSSQIVTSFSRTMPYNIFFSACCFDLSDILPVYHILDTDKNPLTSKKSFSYIRFPDNTRPDTAFTSGCNSLHLNKFRSTVLLI